MKQIPLYELMNRPVWVCWQSENDDGKIKKVPKNPITGLTNARTNDPNTWSTYDVAQQTRHKYHYDGIGLVFSDNLIGIDIDAINHGDDNATDNPLSSEIIDLFSRTYIEKSPSGLGYHIIGLCDIDEIKWDTSKYSLRNPDENIEIYPAAITTRFFTFTGDSINDNPLSDITDEVRQFLEKYMKKDSSSKEIDVVVDKARAASNGKKFCDLYDKGDISAFVNDDSRADLALCSIIAYWVNNDKTMIDTIFRRSALYRDKWERDDYRNHTIDVACSNAIVPCSELESSNGGKKVMLNRSILERWLEENDISLRYNIITHEIEITGTIGKYNRETLLDEIDIIIHDEVKNYWSCSQQLIKSLLSVIASKNSYNPINEMLGREAEWDRTDRLPMLYNIMHIDDTDHLSKALIHKWLLMALAMSKNRYDDAYGADGILVIQGEQGIGKTSLCSKLGVSPKHTKLGLYIDTKEKDTLIRATSCWIGEIGELETTLKSDMERLKAFITADYDRYRLPYGRADSTHPRHSAFIATCNSDKFLVDETGSRRFWTIPCHQKFDLDLLNKLNVIQLWKQIENELNKYTYSTAYNSEYQNCFRLSSSEQDELRKRNQIHEKYLKGQKEVEDILSDASEHPTKYKMGWVTVSQFKNAYQTLRSYSAEQIGRAINRFNIESRDMRLNGSQSVSKGCRLLPIPIISDIEVTSYDTSHEPF